MDSILIVAHGSDESRNDCSASRNAERLTEMLGRKVHYAYKGDAEPTIETALSEISAEGSDGIIVLPLFFAPGMFAETIVPRRFGLEPGQKEGVMRLGERDVRIRIADVFGTHPGMRDVLYDAVIPSEPSEGSTCVMLVGHGSKDGKNKRTVEMNAAYVRGFNIDTESAFNEMNDPSVEECFDDIVSRGYDNIMVVPMFVSPSNHSVNEVPEKVGLGPGQREGVVERGGRTVRVLITPEIGMAPGIAEILADMVAGFRDREGASPPPPSNASP